MKVIKRLLCLLLLLAIFIPCSTECKIHSGERLLGKLTKSYKYQLAACMMFQNEAFFLKEWIEYHKLIGFEHFYLFNNASTDNYWEILEPYVLSGEVELFDYQEQTTNQVDYLTLQCAKIYTHALSLARGKVKWLAIFDADEFIVPQKGFSLLKILKKYERYGGVYVDYLFFGTSHVEKVPEGRLIVETLNHCASKSMAFGKSIVRPERVSSCPDPHRMFYHPPYYHVDTNFETFDWAPSEAADDVLLIHHYYLGDIDHALNVTFPRRKKWMGIEAHTYLENLEWMNERENNSMKRFVSELREKVAAQ